MFWNEPDPKQGSGYAGDPLTLGEMFNDSLNAQRRINNAGAAERFIEEEHDRDIEKLAAAGGRKFDNPMRTIVGRMGNVSADSSWRQDEIARFNKEFYEEAAKYPDLGFDPKRTPFQRWQEKTKAAEETLGETTERAGMAQGGKIPVVSAVGAFGYNVATRPLQTAASFGGSLSGMVESPAEIFASLIGFAGGGKAASLARNMAYDFLGNAAAQTALEPGVQSTRRLAGLSSGWREALDNIAAAGGTGAAIGVGFRAPNRAYRAATGQPGYGGVLKDYAPPAIPKPDLDAIAKAANVDPQTLTKAVQGDEVAFREVLEKSGAMENPEIRGMVQAAEIADELPGIDRGQGLDTLVQMMRAAVDPDEPMPVARKMDAEAPTPKLTPEAAALRKDILEEGNGSVTDVAQTLRANPGLLGRDAPDTAFMQTATGLSHLSDDAFNTVRNGMASPEIGAAVANHVADPSLHAGVLRELTELGITDPVAARRALPDLLPQPDTRAVSDGLLGVQRDTEAPAMSARAGAEVDDLAGPAAKKQSEALEAELAAEIEVARALGPTDPALGLAEKAAATAQRHDAVFKHIASGGRVTVAPEVTAAVHMAARPYSHILPVGTQVGNLEAIRPQAGASRPGDVTATWRLGNGEVVDIDVELGVLLQARALYDRVTGNVLFNALSRHELPDIPGIVATGIHHETVHAWWRNLKPAVRSDLVAHASVLNVLDMQVGTVMKAVGHPSADGNNAHLTIRERYSAIYRNAPDLQDRLDQEAVAHMNELMSVGYFDDADVAPVKDALNRAFGTGSRTPEPGESLMFAASDAATGQAMRRDLDALGYYSHALEVARGLKQAKGTPEQMLAMLKKGGVKDAEIAATKLDQLFGSSDRRDSGAVTVPAAQAGKSVAFEDLPVEVKNDIGGWVMENIPAVAEDVKGVTEYAVQMLEGRVGALTEAGTPIAVRLVEMPLSKLEGYNRSPSELAVAKYKGMLAKSEAPPILVDGNKFVDGGHRVAAYKAAGRTSIPAVDIGPILRMNWQAWIDGSADPSFPLLAPQSGDRTSGSAGRLNQITKSQIISHLEENRVGLKEVVREAPKSSYADHLEDELSGLEVHADGTAYLHGDQFPNRAAAVAEAESRARRFSDEDRPVQDEGTTKWQSHSLDPSNPTYRETVLHLPEGALNKETPEWRSFAQEMRGKYGEDWWTQLDTAESSRRLELSRGNEEMPDFRQHHFANEPNVVGHMMTSMVTDSKGKPVYLIDQIQSDWGQKLRDGGVRDEAKIADLQARLDAWRDGLSSDEATNWRVAVQKFGKDNGINVGNSIGDHVGMRENIERLSVRQDKIGERAREFSRTDPLGEDSRNHRLLRAELEGAKAATPGNPLVNTTDQWVNITLRRAIRQAAEADADAIAIPHGDTVLTYNPGDRKGMAEFYDRIVPKNLRNLLSRMDPESAKPETVDMLETPGKGLTDRGDLTPGVSDDMEGEFNLGFTVFRLTPAVKRAVLEDGQPMFALGGGNRLDGMKAANDTDAGRVPRPPDSVFSKSSFSDLLGVARDEGVEGVPVPGWNDADVFLGTLNDFQLRRLRALPDKEKIAGIDEILARLAKDRFYVEAVADDFRWMKYEAGVFKPAGEIVPEDVGDRLVALQFDSKGNRTLPVDKLNAMFDRHWVKQFSDGQPMFALGNKTPEQPARPDTYSLTSRIMEAVEPYLSASRAAETAGLGVERDASGQVTSVVRDGRRYAITRDADGNMAGITESPLRDGPRDLIVSRDETGAAVGLDQPALAALAEQAERARGGIEAGIIAAAKASYDLDLMPDRVSAYVDEVLDIARENPASLPQKLPEIIARALDELTPKAKPAPDESVPTPLRNDMVEVDRLTEMSNLVSVCKL